MVQQEYYKMSTHNTNMHSSKTNINSTMLYDILDSTLVKEIKNIEANAL